MRGFRGFLIISFFFIDVRVRAETNSSCWGKSIPCAVRSQGHSAEYKAPGLVLVLSASAMVEQKDEKNIRLISGGFYLDVKNPIIFNTPYATFSCVSQCKALVERTQDSVTLKSLEGDWKIVRKGEAKEYFLSAGLQSQISEVDSTGMAHMEFPQAVVWSPTVKQWAAMYPNSFSSFKSDLERFRESWRSAVESSSSMNAEIVQRVVASHEAGLARERARQKAVEEDEKALRALFRKKTDIDP